MLKINALVLYKNELARVTAIENDGAKIAIEYGAQREKQKVRQKDIVLLCANADATDFASSLKSAPLDDAEKRITEAWELLLSDADDDERKTESVDFFELAELAFTKVDASNIWHIFCALTQSVLFSHELKAGEDGFAGKYVFLPRTQTEVDELKNKLDAKKNEGAMYAAFLERLKKRTLNLPDDAHFMQEIESVALGHSTKSRALTSLNIAVTAENAHALLLKTGVWTPFKNPYPDRFGLSSKSASDTLPSPPKADDATRQHIPHTAFAIDNAWSQDPDDAVFFDGSFLWVHIADPASVVHPDSGIDKAARNRGQTLYLPETTARMLAEESLEDYALGLSDISRALSFRLTLDAACNVLECAVLKTLVHVTRLTYESALAQKSSPELAPLFDIAEKNIAKRKASGSIDINLPEVHIKLVNSGESTLHESREVHIETVAHNAAADMVREMMLLAGEGAAKFAFAKKIAFPFVSQDTPEMPENIPAGLAGELKRVKSMQSRTVSTSPALHAGLGLSFYAQVTSPLRRYGDLVSHQQLRAFIDGTPLMDTDTVLSHIAAGDAAIRSAVKAERASNKHWTFVYLMAHPDAVFDAVVVDIKNYQATVLIPSLALQQMLTLSKTAALNDIIPVKCAKIDLPLLQAVFLEA